MHVYVHIHSQYINWIRHLWLNQILLYSTIYSVVQCTHTSHNTIMYIHELHTTPTVACIKERKNLIVECAQFEQVAVVMCVHVCVHVCVCHG